MAIVKDGKIGGVKQEYVYAGGAVIAILLAVVWFRSKKAASAQSATDTGMVTDPAGNQCAALNPQSGYCPGSPQDLAFSGTLVGTNAASYVGGQIIGYDQYGNPIYSSSTTQTGVPGGFTNNAQWAQAAQQYLTDIDQNSNPETIANALGNYIESRPVTEAQRSIIQQAIAFEGYPPVGGPNGNPPGIIDAAAPIPPPPGTTPPPPKNIKPGAITGLHLQLIGATTVKATWHPSNAATSYLFQITVKDPTPHNIGKRVEYEAGDLRANTNYTVHVAGNNAKGRGPWATASIKTKSPVTVPGGPIMRA